MTGSGEHGPLHGIRVVEITMYMQGPTAGLVLAGLGADVIKIEQVGTPDYVRNFASLYGVPLDERGQAWLYGALNRGKRSLALDLVGDAGRALFHRLVAGADVFVTNLRPNGLMRMGADPEKLLAVNPRLVYGRGGGFGFDGPLADDPCQDTVGMAYGGLMDLTAETDQPSYPPGALSDTLTGTHLASAVLAGLVARGQDGKGRVVQTSQLQSLLWLQLLPVGMVSSLGARMPRYQRRANPNPVFGTFPTADGWIAVAVLLDAHWSTFVAAASVIGLDTDDRFATFLQRAQHREALLALLDAHFRTRTTAEWWATLRAGGVWVAPVNRIGDLAGDEQVRANGYLGAFADGFVGSPVPFDVDGWHRFDAVAAAYGEHTDEVLAELGLSADEVLQARIDGAIW